jgi:hypothetical protein
VPAGVAYRCDPLAGGRRRDIRSRNMRLRRRIPITGAPSPRSDGHTLTRIQAAQIQFVVEQVIQRVFKCAGQQLVR